MYYVYILKNTKGDLYAGITENVAERIRVHNSKKGARFTKNKPCFRLVFKEEYGSLSEARQREIQIKKWRRDKKEFLIDKYSKRLETKPTNN